jgi:hypothetical protein
MSLETIESNEVYVLCMDYKLSHERQTLLSGSSNAIDETDKYRI